MGEYGRRLYFNTSNGDILYDTGEMSGDITRPSIPDEIEILGLSEKHPGNVDCVELGYGELRDKFMRGLFFKVNIKNRKIKFYGTTDYQKKYYGKQEIKIEYTEEDIYRFYQDEYINFNLRKLLIHNDPIFTFKWYSLDEINIRPENLEKSWHYYYFDDYIADSANEKTKLAEDILENGTYWPLVVARMPERGDAIFVFEGNHRVLSAKLLQLEGRWDNNRKFLCMEIANDKYILYKGMGGNSALGEYVMMKPITLRMPFVMRFGSTAKPDDPEVIDEMEASDIRMVDEHTIEMETDVYNEFISISQTYPHWLRDIFYQYKQTHNKIILPSPIINDYEAWIKWAAGGEHHA